MTNKFLSNSLKESENPKSFSFCGKEFNLASPKQLGEVLFDDLKIEFQIQKKQKVDNILQVKKLLSKLS